jgi:hypothetical protein
VDSRGRSYFGLRINWILEAGHEALSSAQGRKAWSFLFIPRYVFMVCHLSSGMNLTSQSKLVEIVSVTLNTDCFKKSPVFSFNDVGTVKHK